MKTPILLLSFLLLAFLPASAQLICIRCFDQNDSISSGVNNLISNGSFEQTNCTPGWLFDTYCPNAAAYNCDIVDWTCTGGGTISYPSIFDSTLSIIPDGNNAAYFGNGNAFVCIDLMFDLSCLTYDECTVSGFPAGLPSALPDYGGPTGVSLEQTVTGLTVGQAYVLEFWAGGEPLQGLLPSAGIFALDIGFGKTFLTCKPTDKEFFPLGTVYLVEFYATATSHTIRFTNWGHICADCTELVIDQVRLYTQEELPGSLPECVTGTEFVGEMPLFEVHPNPTKDHIIIDNTFQENTTYTVSNLFGQKILTGKLTSQKQEVDVSFLPAGMYVCSVGRTSLKVIITK